MRVPRVRYAADLLNSSVATADTCWPFSGGSGVTLILRIFTESPELPETHAQQRRAGVRQMAHATVAHTDLLQSLHMSPTAILLSLLNFSTVLDGYRLRHRSESRRGSSARDELIPTITTRKRAVESMAAVDCEAMLVSTHRMRGQCFPLSYQEAQPCVSTMSRVVLGPRANIIPPMHTVLNTTCALI